MLRRSMAKNGRSRSSKRESAMERRAKKVHPTSGEGTAEHTKRAMYIMYAVMAASAWTLFCVAWVATDRWTWNDGVPWSSHLALLAVFGPVTLYALWANSKHGVYGPAIWMLIGYIVVVSLIVFLTI